MIRYDDDIVVSEDVLHLRFMSESNPESATTLCDKSGVWYHLFFHSAVIYITLSDSVAVQ